jgi:hypothetical protein
VMVFFNVLSMISIMKTIMTMKMKDQEICWSSGGCFGCLCHDVDHTLTIWILLIITSHARSRCMNLLAPQSYMIKSRCHFRVIVKV